MVKRYGIGYNPPKFLKSFKINPLKEKVILTANDDSYHFKSWTSNQLHPCLNALKQKDILNLSLFRSICVLIPEVCFCERENSFLISYITRCTHPQLWLIRGRSGIETTRRIKSSSKSLTNYETKTKFLEGQIYILASHPYFPVLDPNIWNPIIPSMMKFIIFFANSIPVKFRKTSKFRRMIYRV